MCEAAAGGRLAWKIFLRTWMERQHRDVVALILGLATSCSGLATSCSGLATSCCWFGNFLLRFGNFLFLTSCSDPRWRTRFSRGMDFFLTLKAQKGPII